MIRALLATVALGLLGLFGYFFVTAPSTQGGGERAKHAAEQTKDVVVDQSVAGLVRARLVARFGLDGARFLHVYHRDGKVLIYGLLPPGVSIERLAAEIDEVPGVREVEVLTNPRPSYVGEPGTGAKPEGGG